MQELYRNVIPFPNRSATPTSIRFPSSYMLYGMTGDPSERPAEGRPTCEAYALDNLLFMAWSAQHSESHDVVVWSPQTSNYRLLHGLKAKTARKVERRLAGEKVATLTELAKSNGLDVNVIDSHDALQGSEFQDIYNHLISLCDSKAEIKRSIVEIVPPWIRAKVDSPEKEFQLAEYAIREVTYILMRADDTKIGHIRERTYDEFSERLVEDGTIKGIVTPSFHYPFECGLRLTSDKLIEPYRVQNNPGARADRILIHETPAQVRAKLDEALKNPEHETHVAQYLQMVQDIGTMVDPKAGSMMSWLPEVAEEYLSRIGEHTPIPAVATIGRAPMYRRPLAAGALAASIIAAIGLGIVGAPHVSKAVQLAKIERESNEWYRHWSKEVFIPEQLAENNHDFGPILAYVAQGRSIDELTDDDLERISTLYAISTTGQSAQIHLRHEKNMRDWCGLAEFQRSQREEPGPLSFLFDGKRIWTT